MGKHLLLWTNVGIFQAIGAFSSVGTGQSQTLKGQPFGVQRCERVRAAYNSRLAGWGFWGDGLPAGLLPLG